MTGTPPSGGESVLDLRDALADAERRLARAGITAPRAEAELLAGHLLGVGRGGVLAAALAGSPAPAGLDALVAERVRRVPLQHLTGVAPFRGEVLRVGPGVFVPRPETEVVAGAAIDAARSAGREHPVVVDLCTGSGAIALSVAAEVPGAVVLAVELAPQAHAWAEANLAGRGVQLRLGDAGSAFDDLDGGVDVVVSNPPYIPDGMVPVDPEVAEHDPAVALFGGGDDGLDVPRAVIAASARLLRPGGVLVMEHADCQQSAVLDALAPHLWEGALGRRDLADRPRFVTAVRRAAAEPGRQDPVPDCRP